MQEVWIPSSLKDKLTHSCPQRDDEKGYVVPWGEECDEGCGATNPPVNRFNKWGHAELVTDELAAELLAKYPGWVVLWSDHLDGVGVPEFAKSLPQPALPSAVTKPKKRKRGR
jgi:hypothetical protein